MSVANIRGITVQHTSPRSRRRFLCNIAQSLLGVSLAPQLLRAAPKENVLAGGSADSVIYLFMKGGMSHIDTFDLKPESPKVQGSVKGIATPVTGVKVTERLPLLAKQMDKVAQVRTMFHTQGNHAPGQYIQYTGYPQETGVIVHPAIGSWVSKLGTAKNVNLPINIRIGSLANHPLSGFFESVHNPLPVADPAKGLQNSRLPKGRTQTDFANEFALSNELDGAFRHRFNSKQVRAYTDLYDAAVRMMRSEDLDAFDLSKEPQTVREQYGDSPFGQGCLLARRLTERGVRFVEVDLDGWDSHTDNHKQVADQCGKLDRPLAALINDLKQSGQLERTLVVLSTEFGRSPFIDENAGRNHHPFGYTCLLAGGGVTGGAVYGKTDKTGNRPTDTPVPPRALNATIAWALGLDYSQYESPFPGGQKLSIAGKDTGEKFAPLRSLFS